MNPFESNEAIASAFSQYVWFDRRRFVAHLTESKSDWSDVAERFFNQTRSGWKESHPTDFDVAPSQTYVRTSKYDFGDDIAGIGRFFVESALNPEGGAYLKKPPASE